DVTTVLLVNNSAHHGRFLTVRPQIGLLTSTVRTFIQNGITTEFATKVVGTKLNNGRLYAQYLKKSSRVFYDNEHLLAPSVVTSWVGEGGETLSLQNHNELFNMDDVVDWQDIDDNLGAHHGEFVGNTDFFGIQTTTELPSVNESISSVQVKVNKPFANNNITATSTEPISKDGRTELTDQLETFTVNNNIRPFRETTTTIQENVSTIQQHRIGKNVESPASKRVLASVTYYGFADFTTIVGDSVIVFSPSSMQSSLNFGHVTSIKGKPTLNLESDLFLNASPSATSAEKIIISDSTSVNNISLEEDEDKGGSISLEEGIDGTFSLGESLSSTPSLGENVASMFSLGDGAPGTLKLKDVASTPLSQEIGDVMATEILSTESESKFIPSDTSSNIIINQKNSGATTVFLDDDPFTNFIELKTDQVSNASVGITKQEEKLETITTTTTVVDNNIIDSSIIKSSQDDSNELSCDHNHLTSQVFLTQMPKSSSIQVSDDSNPFLAFDIVETTKYYCIQASEEVATHSVMTSEDTTTESSREELMPTELIDDLDETTVKNVEDYDVTTDSENDDDYDGNSDEIDLIYKTLYTTYTYLTTFFEGSLSTVSSHTEIITNIISSTLEVGKSNPIENTLEQEDISGSSMATKYIIPSDIVKVLNSETEVSKESITNVDLDNIVYTKTLLTTYTYYTSVFTNNDTEITSRTEVITNFLTDNNTFSTIEENNTHENSSVSLVEPKNEGHKESSSFIQKTPLDDQVSSESNDHDEIMPSATLLLQTSFTTFTFYTTMYVGDDTNIISRLETVTNVATETLKPTKLLSVEDASFPITYFTTYTYWTKLAKDGEITTLSREETLFNVIQPKNNGTEISSPHQATIEKTEEVSNIIDSSSSSTDITTYYTTYTYYTTSYEANSTIIASNLETVTNVVTSSLSSAAEIETSISVTPTEKEIIPTTRNVILYDYKHIIDADEVSTLYFTTEVVSSMNIEGSDIEVTSSTSRLHVDEAKKSILNTPVDENYSSSTSKMYKTGLVRLIEGKRIQNNTTTLYQSKVIGTVIDNRYAQIIESTSSFLYEKAKTDELVIATSSQEPVIEPETQKVEATKSLIGNEEDIADTEDHEATRGDVPQRPFAPVIRPFASRNRPSYAPKQKTLSASSATIITRSDITPTITATPALKSSTGGRYISSRRGIISTSPINPSESNLSQSSRRVFGRPSKSLSNSNDQSSNQASFQPSRNRFASSSRSNPIATSSRRPNISFRPSIAPGFRASGVINNPKLRVRPSGLGSTLAISAQSKAVSSSNQISNEDEGNLSEETSGEEEEEKITKSNPNPLLRFRRPINKPSGFTPITRQSSGVSPAVSLRKNPLLSARSKPSPATSTTTSTTTPKPKSFTFQRPSSLQIRSRPQNSLFPPRGLFQSQKETDLQQSNANEGLTDNDSEYDDSSEDDEDGNQQTVQNQKTSTKLRVRRQVDPVSRSRFRFRRQNTTAISSNIKVEEALDESTLSPRGKTSSRFGSRFHTPDTTTPIVNHKSIRPTRPTSKRPQFTLREKDVPTSKGTTTGRSNFRRQPASGNTSLRRSSTSTGTSNNRRFKSYGNFGNNNNKNTFDNGRASINTSRSRNTNSNNPLSRGRGGSRGRNRNDYSPDLPAIDQETQPITVTHFLPAEVMIPVINGHVTEYKNIVTAKTSTEIVGQNQVTKFAGSNGLTSLYLNREESSVNNAGVTEHTKYLLHESITSTIIFTPTTIRGRKTSFSHILPSTAYSVEYLVTTVQPQISANAPLANILLSQLLLGNLNLPGHPIIQQPSSVPAIIPTAVEPVTEYRTHTSTYVTTIFDGKSTILPVTFQGKKILTTVYDTTAEVITATEYSVDTIVNTAPVIQSQMQQQSVQQVNNLLLQQLLLQQQQQEAQAISKTLTPQIFLNNNLQDLDDATRSILNEDFSDLSIQTEPEQPTKSPRKKSRKSGGGHNRRHKQNHNVEIEKQQEPDQQSIVTLYISGRRPGEFSTVLSTVNGYDHSASLHKRQAYLSSHVTNANQFQPENTLLSRDYKEIIPNEEGPTALNRRTASLESIVGDVDRWLSQSTRQS
ncbi:hypothetical protein KR038_011502, partial [Drosophila bunnanda]